MKNNILIIVGGMVARMPHVDLYIKILDKNSVNYDIVEWNRNEDSVIPLANRFVYEKKINDLAPFYVKLVEIYKFSRYVRKVMKKKRYDKIITFTIADSLYIIPYLVRKFKNNYIFDIRDYSPLCRVPLFNQILRVFINNSYATCISSPGFKKWLPKNCHYTISHNIDTSLIKNEFECTLQSKYDNIKILTIGRLRDYESNKFLIKELSNVDKIKLEFVGDGTARPFLEDYCKKNKISSVYFHGFYNKRDESSFYEKCDMVNICLTRNKLSDYLMSNRFYLSVIHRKPMIVNEGSYQAVICKKYGLGVVIDYNKNFVEQLNDYVEKFNKFEYEKNRRRFISEVLYEQKEFEKQFNTFLGKCLNIK